MADLDLKLEADDATPDETNGGLMGFDGHSAAKPSLYTWIVIKATVLAWLTTGALAEVVQDIVGAFISGVRGVKVTYSDGGNTFVIENILQGAAVTLVANAATLDATFLGKMALVTVGGATNASITLMDPATAGDGAIQPVKKTDAVTGLCIIFQNDGVTRIDIASGVNDTIFLRSTGATWIVYHVMRGNQTRNNFAATTDPAVTDDVTKGYGVGSLWTRTDSGSMWRLRDATTGAAKWTRLGLAESFGHIAGRYYAPRGASLGGSFSTSNANKVYFSPIIISERITISEFMVRVITGSGSLVWQAAVYANDPTTMLPVGLPLGKSAADATGGTGASSTNVASALAVNMQLEPGMYWIAYNTSGNGIGVTSKTNTGTDACSNVLCGSTTASEVLVTGVSGGIGWTATLALGTWPDISTLTLAFFAGNIAAVGYKVVSVP